MPKTLLLADDSVTIQKVVAISFASEDIAITTVDNGDDAIARARDQRPDVVLADVVMPGKSGYEVCEAIKADAALQHIPVLLLTGTFEAFDEERARSVGAAGHVAKPFEAQALVERVKELLAQAPSATPQPMAPQAAPAPAAADPDDAFDFFDDEPAASADRLQDPGDAPLEAEPDDSAFSFADDDLGDDPLIGPDLDDVQPAAPTVAILPDAPPGPPVAGAGDTVLAMPAGPASAGDDLEFEFERMSAPSEARVEGVAAGGVLDPAADSGVVDPTRDDLAPPPGLEPPEATQILASSFDGVDADDEDDDEEEAISSADDFDDDFDDTEDDLLAPEPIDEPLAAEPMRAEPPLAAEPPAPKPIATPETLVAPEPIATPETLVTEARPSVEPPEPRDDRFDAPSVEPPPGRPPALDFAEPEPAFAAEPIPEPTPAPEAPAPALPDAQATAAAVLEQLAPELRAQLHDTLERIAWEAFGEVTDKIVKQAVERVEKAAWEVVPKLAETLILEEIRKLKGE